MSLRMSPIPTSLYIHIPWCVKKCPYCDFNSHTQYGELPEAEYIGALLEDFETSLQLVPTKTALSSIFIGGGTPSLFSAQAYEQLFSGLQKILSYSDTLYLNNWSELEITLEANPESVRLNHFTDYKKVGINRISLGIQSFNNIMLQRLGRAHDSLNAKKAIDVLLQSGFTKFNLDLMFGLPSQTLEEALEDLETALSFPLTHLSWYQLNLEPNTPFYQRPPLLPNDDILWEMQSTGQHLLAQKGLLQYEVSAYARSPEHQCQHNLNYWTFGDYLGIGAGAHGKINKQRIAKIRHPKAYLNAYHNKLSLEARKSAIPEKEFAFEFMLNVLRLTQGVSTQLFSERTGLEFDTLSPALEKAIQLGLLSIDNKNNRLYPTAQGARFLNDLVSLFL